MPAIAGNVGYLRFGFAVSAAVFVIRPGFAVASRMSALFSLVHASLLAR
jgi:hypothetical protein